MKGFKINDTIASILLIILIAIGGMVLFGEDDPNQPKLPHPQIKGPLTPPSQK